MGAPGLAFETWDPPSGGSFGPFFVTSGLNWSGGFTISAISLGMFIPSRF